MTQFGLDTIVALLAIVAGVSGAFHKLILKPIILNFEAARQLDRTKQEAQFKLLQNTLVDLKEEIKISRASIRSSKPDAAHSMTESTLWKPTSHHYNRTYMNEVRNEG